MEMSSLVVGVLPKHLPSVREALQGWPGVQVHAAAGGKLVVTVEADDATATMHTLARIGALDGVTSTALAYHQVEPDPDQEICDGTDAT